jgi:hypothetical protein
MQYRPPDGDNGVKPTLLPEIRRVGKRLNPNGVSL